MHSYRVFRDEYFKAHRHDPRFQPRPAAAADPPNEAETPANAIIAAVPSLTSPQQTALRTFVTKMVNAGFWAKRPVMYLAVRPGEHQEPRHLRSDAGRNAGSR